MCKTKCFAKFLGYDAHPESFVLQNFPIQGTVICKEHYYLLFCSIHVLVRTHMVPRAGTLEQKYFPGGGAIFSVSQTANSNSLLWPGLGGGIYFDWCVNPNTP